MAEINNLILDMDGVLWHGDTPLPGLNVFFETLESLSIPFVLATNNATKTADQYVAKLANFGVSVAKEQILTSSEATASYLRHTYPHLESVYVVGDEGLQKAVKAEGFAILSAEAVRQGAFTEVVVAGLCKSLSYELVAMGSFLVHKGAKFVATNADATLPTEMGPLPGAGAILSIITTATKVKPTVIGKPEPHLFLEALRRLKASPETTAMVGDRLSTDIAGGKAAVVKTILVLSGVSQQTDVDAGDIKPDYIFKDIQELSDFLKLS